MSTLGTSNLAKIRWSGKKPTAKEEREWIEEYQKTHSEDSANKIIVHFIAMVKGVISDCNVPSSYFDDALVEGVLGLLQAAEKFDLTRKNRLSTYAVYYIRLRVMRFIDTKTKIIKVPVNKSAQIRKIIRESEDGIDALPDNLMEIARNSELLSLDYEMESEHAREKTIYDVIPDPAESPDEQYARKELTRELIRVFDTLPPREALTIKTYYGIGEKQRTLSDLADDLGVTHQRTSQLLKSAVKKLKEEPRKTELAKIANLYGVIDFRLSEKNSDFKFDDESF